MTIGLAEAAEQVSFAEWVAVATQLAVLGHIPHGSSGWSYPGVVMRYVVAARRDEL